MGCLGASTTPAIASSTESETTAPLSPASPSLTRSRIRFVLDPLLSSAERPQPGQEGLGRRSVTSAETTRMITVAVRGVNGFVAATPPSRLDRERHLDEVAHRGVPAEGARLLRAPVPDADHDVRRVRVGRRAVHERVLPVGLREIRSDVDVGMIDDVDAIPLPLAENDLQQVLVPDVV